ncbi:MAG: 4Fe-4S binding protein [Deltaproteobacteria bacterium]|nr:4Fe-4S binding protein [Deltaproteobacteria bacterium]
MDEVTAPGRGAMSRVLSGAALLLLVAALAIPFLPGHRWGFWAADGRGSLAFLVSVGGLLAAPSILLAAGGRRWRGLVIVLAVSLLGFLQWESPRSIEAVESLLYIAGSDRPVEGWLRVLVRPAALLGLALLFGRYFCGWLCPMGALQEMLHRPRLRVRMPRRLDRFLKLGKYVTAAVLVLAPLLFQARLVRQADPFTPVFNLQRGLRLLGAGGETGATIPYGQAASLDEFYEGSPREDLREGGGPVALYGPALLAFTVLVLLASVFLERPFCRYLSPVGGLLALLARLAPVRLRVLADACVSCGACERECSVGALRMEGAPPRLEVDVAECIACRDCEGVCPPSCLRFGANAR